MNIVSKKNQQARKKHKCNSCLTVIEIGETYVATFITDGGDAWKWRDHIICDKIGAIRIPYFNEWDDEVADGWLNDDMQDAGFTDKNEYLKYLEAQP
jgi:hypothetical protein